MKAVYLEEGAVNKGDISLDPIKALIETKVYKNTTEEDKYDHIGDAEVVFTNKVIFDEETFERCPNLKYIGVCATGYNVIDIDAARRHNVVVTNVPAYSTESVAQLTWGFILECASHIAMHNESVHRGDWCRSETFCYWLDKVMELEGKTLGIIGYGNIGRRVAEIGLAFKMNIIVSTAHPERYEEKPGLRFVSLEDIWKESHIISLHCPMTKETEKIICQKNISQMRDGVIIINVSRGGLIDENDLSKALSSGKVAAAAVDVVSLEPMEEANPLLKAPNLTITPHIAWASIEARGRLIETVAENFKAYMNGERLNIVV
ncbi:MAG: D-2-hydroxyacid dehydrogenase [Eubacterium sp.]|nr:D-2-hydroxyacid dehydrogenase [Eubacterium sp.]